jgi:transposase
MQLTLAQRLSQFGHLLQDELFPIVEQACGEMDDTAKRFATVLQMVEIGRFIPSGGGYVGRPARDRVAIGHAFVAKAVYGMSLTRQLIQRLRCDEQLRKLCGWSKASHVPSESKFSRVFAEFAEMQLPQFVHEALVQETQKDRLIGHISRDSTAIEARERYAEEAPRPISESKRKADEERMQARQLPLTGGVEAPDQPAKKKRGRKGPRGPHKRYKGGKRKYQPNQKSRLHRQRSMKLPQMLEELPTHCSLGVKTSHDGNQQYWRGYKLHLDVADGQIPISAVVTAAALHDSQVAIPLATMTAQRVINLYDVMDAAYDAIEILDHSRGLGHVPIVRPVRRKGKRDGSEPLQPTRSFTPAEQERFKERTTVERVNARLKDEFGIRDIRVRGHRKVAAHLMFAVLALTADQILKLM